MSKQILAIVAVIVVMGAAGYFTQRSMNAPSDAETSLATTASETVTPVSTDEVAITNTNQAENNTTKKMYTQATFKTSLGDIVIVLDNTNTPKTVENFTKLASSGFYNGTKFHRVIKDFMIQGGDPQSKDDSKQAMWGTGGPGYQFDDEIKPTNSNAVGTISMANAGPNTNGSQFFINVADNAFLNGKHTVFGKVTAGYEIVERMSKVATAPGDRPVEPLIITSIELK